MAHFNPISAISHTWETLGLVWLIGLAFTKRTVRSQALGPRIFEFALAVLGFTLVGSRNLGGGWLGEHFLSPTESVQLAGLALTVAGCLFAIWARVTLGSNWSGRATVKASHELVVRGPYALARHPIYTGLLVGSMGTAAAEAEWRCVLGLVLIVLVFAVKMGQEEKLMLQTFPEAYMQYRRQVKALIPGVL